MIFHFRRYFRHYEDNLVYTRFSGGEIKLECALKFPYKR